MNEDWKSDVIYLHGLLQQTYTDANDAYSSLNNYDGEMKYQIAINFLIMSYQSYLLAKHFYQSNEHVQHQEFEDYFKAYKDFKFQMNHVISEKDSNITWLFSNFEKFKRSMDKLNLLINDIQS